MFRTWLGLIVFAVLVAACSTTADDAAPSSTGDATSTSPASSSSPTAPTTAEPTTEVPASTSVPSSTVDTESTHAPSTSTTYPLQDDARRAGVPNTSAGFDVRLVGDRLLGEVAPSLLRQLELGGELVPRLTRSTCEPVRGEEWATVFVFGGDILEDCEVAPFIEALEAAALGDRVFVATPPSGTTSRANRLRQALAASETLAPLLIDNAEATIVDGDRSQPCAAHEPCVARPVGASASTVVGGDPYFCPKPTLDGSCQSFNAGAFRYGLSVSAPVVAAAYREVTGLQTTTAAADPPSPELEPYADPLALGPSGIAVLGDSVADSSIDWLEALLELSGPVDVDRAVVNGGTVCGYGNLVRSVLRTPPDVAIFIFSGNTFHPCMQDENGDPLEGLAYYAKHETDLRDMVTTFTELGIPVILGDVPRSRLETQKRLDGSERLNDIARRVADQDPLAHFVAASAGVLDERGNYREFLPCLANEPCLHGVDDDGNGVNVVRETDGVHFCPGGFAEYQAPHDVCPTWSSGALRYAGRLASTAVDLVYEGQSVIDTPAD